MPKVSVIIPVYNTEKYLRKCLDSVCNQTLSDIEIICVNDCSTDNSFEIIKEYALKDDRIKLIDFKENKGAAVARNSGINEAKGEYIGFVDSDDFIDLDFYEKLYNKAHETNADCAKGELWEINDKSKEPFCPYVYDLNKLIVKNQAYFYFTYTSAIYNRIFLNKYNIKFPAGLCHLEDPCFTIKAALYYSKIVIVDNVKYYYVLEKENRNKKSDELDITISLSKGVNLIMNMINNALNITKEHYLIVSTFLISQIKDRLEFWGNRNDNVYNTLLVAMHDFFKKCKYKEEILSFYYANRRSLYLLNAKNNVMRNLRKGL